MKGVSQAGECLLTDQLETNLACFIQWGLINIGGFLNVTKGMQGGYGGDLSQLRPVADPRYNAGNPGQVWEACRQDWVHETGVSCTNQPIRVSGVYVNNAFHPIGESGAFSYHVDYRTGQVVFETPIDPTSMVQCEYTFRLYHVSTADVPWWRQIQLNSIRVDDPDFLTSASGAWSVLAQNRVQLPHIIIEGPPMQLAAHEGRELGNAGVWVREQISCHVLAEDRTSFKFLTSVIAGQVDLRFMAFDKNLVLQNNKFPLGPDGDINDDGQTYPGLVNSYCWRQVEFLSTNTVPICNGPTFFAADVNCVMKTDID